MVTKNSKPFDGKCRICGASNIPGAPGYSGLVDHILSNRRSHKQAVYWAKHFNAKKMERHITKIEKAKIKDKPAPATPEQIQSRKDARLNLSNVNGYADTFCFTGNHIVYKAELPIEFINSPEAWRLSGILVVNCSIHKKHKDTRRRK
jgi:hypothetical protein